MMDLSNENMNLLMILEQARFWKRQEAEHTVVIQEIVDDLEEMYVDMLNEYKTKFDLTEEAIDTFINNILNSNSLSDDMYQDIMQLINVTVEQSSRFVEILKKMLSESNKVNNSLIGMVVINHIRRESEYYINLVKSYLDMCL